MLNENYYQVSGWMVNVLGLKGIELQIFAIIYGFTQDDETEFIGSIKYLCEWTNTSRPTVSKSLAELVRKDLLIKRAEIINNVTFNRYKINYQAVKKLYGGSKETLWGGSKETLHNNNILDNNKDNKELLHNSLSTDEKKDSVSVNEVVKMYHEICKSYPQVRAMSATRKKAVSARLKEHGIETIREVFEKAENSPFLKGENNRNWTAKFDWIMNDNNFVKILDGNYDSQKSRMNAPKIEFEQEPQEPETWE